MKFLVTLKFSENFHYFQKKCLRPVQIGYNRKSPRFFQLFLAEIAEIFRNYVQHS